MPAPEFFLGIQESIHHAQSGHSAYLLGEASTKGWWYYSPVVLGVKNRTELSQCLAAEAAGALPADLRARIDGLGLAAT